MGLVMRDRGRDMRDRGEGPRRYAARRRKASISLVTHLSLWKQSDARFSCKIPDIQDGQLPR